MMNFKIKPALIVGFVSAGLVLLGGTVYGNFYLSKNIFPRVMVGQTKIGGMEYAAAFNLLKDKYNENNSITLSSSGQEKDLTYRDLGIQFKTGETLKSAHTIGRSWDFNLNIEPIISVNYAQLNESLNKLFPDVKKDPIDAKFIYRDAKLQIEPEQFGVSFNALQISQALKKSVSGATQNQKITVVTKQSQPTLISQQLNFLLPKAQTFIDTNPVLTINNKSYSPTKGEATSFIKVNIENGEPTIAVADDNLKQYIADLGKKTLVASTPDIYFDTGELSSKGTSGKKIDEDQAFAQLETAYLSDSSAPIKLATIVVPSSKKVVNRGYTPGLYAGKYIEVDLSNQQLFQMEGSQLVATRRVSTGKWSMPTPVGTFSINNKNPRAYSSTYDLYMPYWMAFIGSKYGLHELPEWADGRKEGQNHLGVPVSHGCIRLGVGDAGQVYDWAEIGTPVVIHR